MLSIALPLLLAVSTPPVPAQTFPFEIASNKPFVRVTVDGSAPLWFILDTGNNGGSVIAQECADRLKLARTTEERADVGAGSGADVRLARIQHPVVLRALGETLGVASPTVMTLGHVGQLEGRRVDGLLGSDFMFRHIVQLDYAKRTVAVLDPTTFEPPDGAVVLPLELDTRWPVVRGTITPRGGKPIRCRLLVDTGMRGVVTMFRPFSEEHGLHDSPGSLHDLVIGGGAGGISRGDVGRVEGLSLGEASFPDPVAIFSRDTKGIFTIDDPQGIVGGEILKRHRVTFDYPHERMILEPYPGPGDPFEYDMSGLFLAVDKPGYAKIRIVSVNPKTPAAEAGLQSDDEIVAIDGQRAPKLTLDQARTRLRSPGARQLEIRRGDKVLRVKLEARRLV